MIFIFFHGESSWIFQTITAKALSYLVYGQRRWITNRAVVKWKKKCLWKYYNSRQNGKLENQPIGSVYYDRNESISSINNNISSNHLYRFDRKIIYSVIHSDTTYFIELDLRDNSHFYSVLTLNTKNIQFN